MLFFGVGPGLYLDFATFIFQVPSSDSWACAAGVPASTSARAAFSQTKTIVRFIVAPPNIRYGDARRFVEASSAPRGPGHISRGPGTPRPPADHATARSSDGQFR